ncbi:hypothetical protein SAMN05661080_01992 [Modestobacter sp. DSM 44400]|uniref:hypothetical protein n=1 Tax=Modestobacter sp. DSM 44400 TaxID=1550230 RepID=UPI000895674D|nr:hypothetical protein [Modestobacter sp. DSM 44400]SDX99974.1 hypothetical protein SAMN05661080_01992 [Modestobacter sp. DSM 44400]
MRPTIDEQLDGVRRLLDGVGSDDGLSAASRELLRNAGRLVKHVRGSWAPMLPFLVEDNAKMTTLLTGLSAVVPQLSADIDAAVGHAAEGADLERSDLDVAAVSARNAELRALLARAIHELPRSPAGLSARTEIGAYLTRRVDIDPT